MHTQLQSDYLTIYELRLNCFEGTKLHLYPITKLHDGLLNAWLSQFTLIYITRYVLCVDKRFMVLKIYQPFINLMQIAENFVHICAMLCRQDERVGTTHKHSHHELSYEGTNLTLFPRNNKARHICAAYKSKIIIKNLDQAIRYLQRSTIMVSNLQYWTYHFSNILNIANIEPIACIGYLKNLIVYTMSDQFIHCIWCIRYLKIRYGIYDNIAIN